QGLSVLFEPVGVDQPRRVVGGRVEHSAEEGVATFHFAAPGSNIPRTRSSISAACVAKTAGAMGRKLASSGPERVARSTLKRPSLSVWNSSSTRQPYSSRPSTRAYIVQ